MKTITQTLIGETAEWERVNPILLEGMLGVEILKDRNRRIKIGDGKSTWKDPALKALNPLDIEGLQDELDKIEEIAIGLIDISDAVKKDEEKLQSLDESLKDIMRLLSSEETEDIKALFRDITKKIESADEELKAAIKDEANTRQKADELLQTAIEDGLKDEAELRDETDNALRETDQALRDDFNAWIGRGGYLSAVDFGAAEPAQDDLTDQALLQIPSIDDALQIWNGTKIRNLFDGHLWILTNTQDTDPPVFEWTDQGTTELLPFTADKGGYIIGANENDPPEFVRSQPNGKGKINIEAIVTAIFEREYPVGSTYEQKLNDLTPQEKGLPGQWENWSGRADGYRLGALPLPYDRYASGIAYAANAFVVNPLNGGWGIYRASAAITAANNAVFNPEQWTLELSLAVDEHIPYRLFAQTSVFAINDLAVNYWPQNYVPAQVDYAVNAAYSANAYVKVLIDAGHWKIYKALSAITAANNTVFNPEQWKFIFEVRQGYKGVFKCTAANTVAATPVLDPAQWAQIESLVPSNEILPFISYTPNANYNANTYVLWHLPGTGFELYKAKAAITAAEGQLNPVLWDKNLLGDIVERRFLQGWLDDDFEIGHVIEDGEYAGLVVSEVLSLGGTFPSYEGGNRPPFVSGGVQLGRITPVTGQIATYDGSYNPIQVINASGVFSALGDVYRRSFASSSSNESHPGGFGFDIGRAVSTGPDVAPITLSVRYWRRVA